MSLPCRICGNADGNQDFVAREMMFGTREEFAYFECASCGCVQIAEVPADLDRHYPAQYYSLSTAPGLRSRLLRAAEVARVRLALGQSRPMGAVAAALVGQAAHAGWTWLVDVPRDAAILDVGAGGGERLAVMAAAGFVNLTGVEPHLEADVAVVPGVKVLAAGLADVEGSFDLVMFHHSFEHIADQRGALQDAARLLAPGGVVLIRIPVADSFAWRTYGIDWVQLDPPRHLYLHTQRSLALLAAASGLRVDQVVHDSGPFQFWGSELHQEGIPVSERSWPLLRAATTRFRRSSRTHHRRARALNAAGEGDQAAFYLSGAPEQDDR